MTMLSYSGRDINVKKFTADDVYIEDIAHALSLNCRYNGHCKRFYSVAEHSLILSNIMELNYMNLETQLYALMHDASEAYLSDVPTPIKDLIPEYMTWENNIMTAILEYLGDEICSANPKLWLKEIDYEFVHKADKSMVFFEMQYLFEDRPKEFSFKEVLMLPVIDFSISSYEKIENEFNGNYARLITLLKSKYSGVKSV